MAKIEGQNAQIESQNSESEIIFESESKSVKGKITLTPLESKNVDEILNAQNAKNASATKEQKAKGEKNAKENAPKINEQGKTENAIKPSKKKSQKGTKDSKEATKQDITPHSQNTQTQKASQTHQGANEKTPNFAQNAIFTPESQRVEVIKNADSAEIDEAKEEILEPLPKQASPKSQQIKPQSARNPLLQTLGENAFALKESKKEDKKDRKSHQNKQIKSDSKADSALKTESKAQIDEVKPIFEEALRNEEIFEKGENAEIAQKSSKKSKQEAKIAQSEDAKEQKAQVRESKDISTNSQTQRMQTIYRSALAKESVRNFASALREEVLNYKPPVTRLSMELHPQNLGTLELIISKKGKDLLVQVVSNAQAVGLFMQNQIDFRNQLAQIGFDNVDLSFSSFEGNGNKGQNGSQSGDSQNHSEESEGNKNRLENEEMQIMNITLPKYA